MLNNNNKKSFDTTFESMDNKNKDTKLKNKKKISIGLKS
jgi:hypothetical protein